MYIYKQEKGIKLKIKAITKIPKCKGCWTDYEDPKKVVIKGELGIMIYCPTVRTPEGEVGCGRGVGVIKIL